MEKKIIKLSIDVSKIDKSKLYNGQKGTYLNAVLMFKDEPDKYGNIGFIVQDTTKEEREAGKRGEILGNAKYLAKSQPSETTNNSDSSDNDLPF